MAGTTRELNDRALVAAALRRLLRRPDVRRVEALARARGTAVRITGGSVRDAFLACLAPRGARRFPPGDLDLAMPPETARGFAESLATRAKSRVLALGGPPRRVLRVPWGARDVDVWEEEGGIAGDLLRRDFTVNALAFELPGGRFAAPVGALADLRSRRLALPRVGVLLEDPLRVLRAARFVATRTGFRLAPSALPEIRAAARKLPGVAPERRLAEWDLLLAAPAGAVRKALARLEGWGALAALLPGLAPRERLRGARLAGRLACPDPRVARVLLLSPLGARGALDVLATWRVSRRERQLAAVLLALPVRRPSRPTSRREAVETLRAAHPFASEAAAFLAAAGGRGARILGEALRAAAPTAAMAERLVRPRRPLPAAEIANLLGLEEGPALGAALADLDVALASGEVRGVRATRAFLARQRASAR